MAETANYTYEGKASLNLGFPAATQSGNIEILSVQHLIPINVGLRLNGKDTVIGAYVDYTDKSVSIPPGEIEALQKESSVITASQVSQAVQQFLNERLERQMAESEAQQTSAAQENYRQAMAARASAWARAQSAMEEDE